jgi:predicted enzyme related to lactoylglutathione lyase
MKSGARLVTLIPIRDMNRALKFYTKAMGGKLNYRGTGEMKDFWASVQLGEDQIWLVAPQKREKRTLAYSTFVVKNIKSFVKGLQGKGVKFLRAEKMSPDTKVEGPIASEKFGSSAMFRDTEGNLLMVWQNGPDM